MYGQLSSTSSISSLSSSVSSTSSLQPSLSQSVEAAGLEVSWLLVQLNWPPRGQRSGKLSVKPSLSSSESQASPCASPSVLSWVGLESFGQLSAKSGTPSKSASFFEFGSIDQIMASQFVAEVSESVPLLIEPPPRPPPTVTISDSLMAREYSTS